MTGGTGAAGEAALEILKPGLATTVQDLGRPGHGRFGVSPSGALDRQAHRLANRLVGNPESAAGLEITGAGCEIIFSIPIRFALAGADLDAALDGQPLAPNGAASAPAGARLQFRQRRRGARAALAVQGGLLVPPALGSAATDLGARLGGIGGRPLRAGQKIAVHRASDPGPHPRPGAADVDHLLAVLAAVEGDAPGVLRLVLEDDPAVPARTRAGLAEARFRISSRSGRTGYRFEGEPLPVDPDPARLSEPTAPGAIQLPPDGLPILLLADRNTIGGYPRLGHLCSADTSRAAQLWPGDPVALEPVSLAEATRLAREGEAHLQAIFAALAPG